MIGILGGMGPEATLYLFEKIIENTPASRDQEHLRVIIDNNPKIPDRTQAIFGKGENPVPLMVGSGMALEKAGADFIVIPCVSAHFFLEDLRNRLKLPILSIFDETASLIERDYQSIEKVGLLATTGTINGGLFQERLRKSAIETVSPDPDDQQSVMSAIYTIKGTKRGPDREGSREELIHVSERLIEKGAQGIIAGCTEIPLALKPEDLSVPLFDSILVLALAAVREAGREPVVV